MAKKTSKTGKKVEKVVNEAPVETTQPTTKDSDAVEAPETAVESVENPAEENPATGKVDHDCNENYRTIGVGGVSTKQCRVCGSMTRS